MVKGMTITSPESPAPANAENAEAATPTGKPKSQPRVKRPGDVALRHQVSLTLSVASMTVAKRELLAVAASSSPEDIANLVVDTLKGESEVRGVLSSLLEVADADPMEAGILATVLATNDKTTFRVAWRVLIELGGELPSSPPASPAQAGLAYAKAAQAIDDATKTGLLRSLLRELSK
jgi:hypothetical protein